MTNKSSFKNDIEKLEKIYTPAQIITNLKTTKALISNEVCELVALRYSIPLFQRFYERKLRSRSHLASEPIYKPLADYLK